MADTQVKNNIFNADSFTALAMKILPVVSTFMMYEGVISKEQGSALVAGAPDFIGAALIVVGGIGNGATVVWNFWKNRKAKRIADVAAMPEATVKVSDPALAAKVDQLTPATTLTVAPQ